MLPNQHLFAKTTLTVIGISIEDQHLEALRQKYGTFRNATKVGKTTYWVLSSVDKERIPYGNIDCYFSEEAREFVLVKSKIHGEWIIGYSADPFNLDYNDGIEINYLRAEGISYFLAMEGMIDLTVNLLFRNTKFKEKIFGTDKRDGGMPYKLYRW